MNVSGVI